MSDEQRQLRRSDIHCVNLVLSTIAHELVRIASYVLRNDADRMATCQRDPLFYGTVEDKWSIYPDFQFFCSTRIDHSVECAPKIANGAMRNGHAFGITGRSRGIDYVGEAIRHRIALNWLKRFLSYPINIYIQ